MDTLALLCNLHADGPETLHRLRTAGWDSLAELSDVEPGELAKALDVTATRAKRFQREAQYLATRLGDDPDSNEGPIFKTGWTEPDAQVSVAPDGRPKGRGKGASSDRKGKAAAASADGKPSAKPNPKAVSTGAASSGSKTGQAATTQGGRDLGHGAAASGSGSESAARENREPDQASMMDRVLASWREADALQPPQPPGDMIFPAPSKATEPVMVPGEVDGLDAATVATLAAAGVVRLAQLAESATLELSSITKLDFTRLLRLQFLARRKLEASASSAPTESTKTTLGLLHRSDPAPQPTQPFEPKMGNAPGFGAKDPAVGQPSAPTSTPATIPAPTPRPAEPRQERTDLGDDFHDDGDVAGPFA